MNFTTKDIYKFIAQAVGFLMGIAGFILIWRGVQATGKIKLTSKIISGEIETGSAGLLLMFLAFFLIIIPTFLNKESLNTISEKNETKPGISGFNDIQRVLIGISTGIFLTCTLFICAPIAAQSNNVQFSNFLVFGGYSIGIITGIIIIFSLFSFIDGDK